MADDHPTYTTHEVARRLGVSLQTVQRWVDAGHLKAWKTLGGHRRIDAASAESLFRSQLQASPGEAAEAGAPAPARAICAVIVDDDPIDRVLLADLVGRAVPEARIVVAGNGFQGLLAIGQASPEIVVSDIQMPHMNGLEMMRELTTGTGPRPRTLVAVSAHAERDLAALGSLPPGVLYLPKPVDEARFFAALRRGS